MFEVTICDKMNVKTANGNALSETLDNKGDDSKLVI